MTFIRSPKQPGLRISFKRPATEEIEDRSGCFSLIIMLAPEMLIPVLANCGISRKSEPFLSSGNIVWLLRYFT